MSYVQENRQKTDSSPSTPITDPIQVELGGDLQQAVAYGKAFDSMIKAIFPGLMR